MQRSLLSLLVAATISLAPAGAEDVPRTFREILLDTPDAARARAYHDALCREPHYAGSAGERRAMAYLAKTMEGFGLDVERHEFFPYLPVHEGSLVEVLTGERRIELPVQEAGLEADPDSRSPKAGPAWNAYAAAGDITAGVVFVNYGTEEDFAKLAEIGESVRGKIAIIRYGEIYRGNKVRAAEDAGAVGVLLYTDPDDAGYRLGIPYPEGGWANEHYIQRGSLHSLGYPGDPLTPGAPATENAPRLAPGDVPLPRIPVQPLGWGAASEILSRMRGPRVPDSWQGGLPFAYRVSGGEDLKVRLQVRQTRTILKSANVLGVLEGSEFPEQRVFLGCHYDAWTFGAGDPNAGTIVLLEIARAFAEAAKAGHRPARTIVFAHWAGEEFGVIGSTEYCEEHATELLEGAVAYVNMDMAAMGPSFRASASPLMQSVVEAAAREVPQIGRHERVSAWEAWEEETGARPELGDLGGGSDHLSFMARLGVPVAAFGAWGSSGVSYHSNYETLTWYRKVVGDDYEPAKMLARIGGLLALHLADDAVLPLDPSRIAPALRGHLATLSKEAGEAGARKLAPLGPAIDRLDAAARGAAARLAELDGRRRADPEILAAVNRELLHLERGWLYKPGLRERPWYKSLYNGTDPKTGYGAWPLPLLREALASGEASRLEEAVAVYRRTLDAFTSRLDALMDEE